jgi:hypothetical protein
MMAAREEHPLKANSSIDVTVSGIVMAAREEQPQKASSPIDVTPFAKVTSVSSRLPLKLSTPVYTTELGISGRIEVVVLIALEVRYGVNAWMERRRLKVRYLGDVVLLGTKFKLKIQYVWIWCR